MSIKSVFLCLTLFAAVALGKKAPFITPCAGNDEDCMLSSTIKALPTFVKGDPELGITPIDPMVINGVHIEEGGLNLHLNNFELRGLAKTEFIKVNRDATGLNIYVEFKFPANCKGDYNVSGTYTTLPVAGNGIMELFAESIHVTIKVALSYIEKDGVKYFKVGKLHYEYQSNGKVEFNFGNLFNGDKSKAEPVMAVLNSSANEVLHTIGKPIIDKLVTIAFRSVKKLCEEVPANELEIA